MSSHRIERDEVYEGDMIARIFRAVYRREAKAQAGEVLVSAEDTLCGLCGFPEGEHAAHGDWCPSNSEDTLFSRMYKFTPIFADRVCECGAFQSEHIIGRFCPPKNAAKSGLLSEFSPRTTQPEICSECQGYGNVQAEWSEQAGKVRPA
jgi:hypothetical protein